MDKEFVDFSNFSDDELISELESRHFYIYDEAMYGETQLSDFTRDELIDEIGYRDKADFLDISKNDVQDFFDDVKELYDAGLLHGKAKTKMEAFFWKVLQEKL